MPRRGQHGNIYKHSTPVIRPTKAELNIYLPTDPAAAWNTKAGRGRFGYFTNYMIDTAPSVIMRYQRPPRRGSYTTLGAQYLKPSAFTAGEPKAMW